LAKIPKKVQVIADNLQKVDVKVGGSGGGGRHGSSSVAKGGGGAGRDGIVYSPPKIKGSPAAVEVHAVEPVFKAKPDVYKPKGKAQRKKKKEVIDATKKESPEKEERSPGYAGLARRIARRFVGEIRGKPKFWFDD
jgi:hypothetical protein